MNEPKWGCLPALILAVVSWAVVLGLVWIVAAVAAAGVKFGLGQ